MRSDLFTYCLHLADNALILAHRNSEWCGHGPVLEQDIALTNISLDLLGGARNFYQYAVKLYNSFSEEEKHLVDKLIPRLWKTYHREMREDDLAFLRDEQQYLNVQLTELPKGDWAFTILRQFFFSTFYYYFYTQLQKSGDATLAAIAEKSIKEVRYHTRWSSEWVIRLGDGTEESHQRMIQALDELWSYCGAFFVPAEYEQTAVKEGYGVDISLLKEEWRTQVAHVFEQAKLPILPAQTFNRGLGKDGKHSEYLGYILTEMQYLQKTYPNVTW